MRGWLLALLSAGMWRAEGMQPEGQAWLRSLNPMWWSWKCTGKGTNGFVTPLLAASVPRDSRCHCDGPCRGARREHESWELVRRGLGAKEPEPGTPGAPGMDSALRLAMPTGACQCPGSTGNPRGSWTPGCWVGIPWGLCPWSWGVVRMGTRVMVSLPQGWPGAHRGCLPSGYDRPGADGEMTWKWSEQGLGRRSRGRQGKFGGVFRHEGGQAAGGCAGHDHRLCFGREKQSRSRAQSKGHCWLLEEAKMREVEKRGIFQSRQGQRAWADCQKGLEKERRKTSALQEEKRELQKVGAFLAFQWAQSHTGGKEHIASPLRG